MQRVVAVVGSRTFPVPKAEFDNMSKAQQRAVLKRGEEFVRVETLKRLKPGDKVVSGKAAGPDTWGVNAAKAVGHPYEEFPAQWRRPDGSVNRAAGKDRNTTIVDRCTEVLAFWDGVSSGTRDTITKADTAEKFVEVVYGNGRVKTNAAKLARKAAMSQG